MSNLNNSLGLCLLVSALMLLMQLSIADIVTNEVNDNIDSYSKCFIERERETEREPNLLSLPL